MELRVFKIGLTENEEPAGAFLINRQIQKAVRYPIEIMLNDKLVTWDNFRNLFDYILECCGRDIDNKPFGLITYLDFTAHRCEYYKEGALNQDLRSLTLDGLEIPCYLDYPDFTSYEGEILSIILKKNSSKYRNEIDIAFTYMRDRLYVDSPKIKKSEKMQKWLNNKKQKVIS